LKLQLAKNAKHRNEPLCLLVGVLFIQAVLKTKKSVAASVKMSALHGV
jgi:hypothetical protein